MGMAAAVRSWLALALLCAIVLHVCVAAEDEAECDDMTSLLQVGLGVERETGASRMRAAAATGTRSTRELIVRLASNQTEANGCIWSVALARDASRLATGSCDNKLRVYTGHTANGPLLTTVTDAEGQVGSVSFWSHHDHRLLGASSMDKHWRLYNATPDAPVLIAEKQEAGWEVDAFAFSADSPIFAASSADGDTSLYSIQDPTKPELMGVVPSNGLTVTTVAIIPHGARMAIGFYDGTLKIYRTTDAGLSQIDQTDLGATVYNVAYSPNNELLAVASGDKTATLFGNLMEAGEPMEMLAKIEGAGGELNTVAFSPCSKLLATGSWDSKARIYDISTPSAPVLLATITDAEDRIYSVAFAEDPSGQLVFATGSEDGNARLYHIN